VARRRRTTRRTELLAAMDREGRRTGSVASLHARAIADRTGLNGSDFEALDVLDWTGPITAGELARRVGLTSGAITGVVDRLEHAGWVRRGSDPADRRRVIVEMVPVPPVPVEQQIAMMQPLVDDMDAVNERFDDDQLQTVLDWLQAANDAVERSTARLRGG
jgi:DNA-binding MarR family transcriptional regulator